MPFWDLETHEKARQILTELARANQAPPVEWGEVRRELPGVPGVEGVRWWARQFGVEDLLDYDPSTGKVYLAGQEVPIAFVYQGRAYSDPKALQDILHQAAARAAVARQLEAMGVEPQPTARLEASTQPRPRPQVLVGPPVRSPATGAASAASTPHRLAWAVLRGLGRLPVSVMEIPPLVSEGLERLSGGALRLPGVPEYGETTRKWEEYTRQRGGLQDTLGETVAELIGEAPSFILTWPAGTKLLSGLARAAKLKELACIIEHPQTPVEEGLRGALVGGAVMWPLLEAPRQEERTDPLTYAGWWGALDMGAGVFRELFRMLGR